MKINTAIRKAPIRLMAVVLAAASAATAARAAAPALQGHLVLRPLTPGDVANYKLPTGTEVSGGLNTVGIGAPVYLEADINTNIPTANIVSVAWVLTNTPIGSKAAFYTSPLGTNVPISEPSERGLYRVAARTALRTDLAGQYTVTATITTTTNGTTNVTQVITAGTYMGVNTCALCHSGGQIADNKVATWQKTAHAGIFSEGIDGLLGHYSASCLACHTAGYDANTNAVNAGFDDVMKQTGWVFPTNQVPGNWASMQTNYPTLATLGNIQCENCHGPGSQHAFSLGNTNFISVTLKSGACNQCHDAPTHHVKGTEWNVSRHGLTTGPSSANCTPCHSANGFIARIGGAPGTNAPFTAITCQACHEPHGDTIPADNPHLIRTMDSVTMGDGSVVTGAGEGLLCLECHHVRNGSATNQLVNYPIGKPTWWGGSSFGTHDNPQGDMILGVNAHTYGQNIPSSAHRTAITNLCVTCHMQATATTDAAFLLAGGHTFNMSGTTTNGTTIEMTAACVQCHGQVGSFDMVRQDYNTDGVIEGVQTEVQKLLDKLSTLLPSSTYVSNGNYVADGIVKTSVSFKTNWPTKFLKAGYNWQFVANDGSKGVHNAPFATGLLKASIADLTGDANIDGLPDWWQVQYFGSTTAPSAAPNAIPAGDGVPNWAKYALGVNPMVPGVVLTNGVVWANGTSLVNAPGTTNSVRIYTAAEISFNTIAGKTYQLQAISGLGAGWQNVGGPVTGNGTAMSYVTPTRANVQQYYRVSQLP